MKEEIFNLLFNLEEYLVQIDTEQKKIKTLLGDISQSYFDKDINDKGKHCTILYDYEQYSVKNEMVCDYVWKSEISLKSVNESFYQLFDLLKEANKNEE